MKKNHIQSSGIKTKIFLFCLITATSFTGAYSQSGWTDVSTIELQESGASGMVWLPNGDEVIISTGMGQLARYNVRTNTRVWSQEVGTNRLGVLIADINPSGTEMVTFCNENAVGADINLAVRSTADGSVIKVIAEESDYVEKKFGYNDPLDLRRTNNAEDVSWQMMPSSAHYDANGGLICVWKNSMETFAMFDHSFVAYNSNYEKMMEWQQVSLNNPGSRNGNMAGFPRPIIRRLDAENYVYGDADCDLYVLDQKTIASGTKNFQIEDKTTGAKIFSRPFEEDIAVTGLEVRGNNIHVTIAGSGYAHYRIYNATTLKPISANWLELGSDDYYMEVSATGKYMMVGRDGFRIYNTTSLSMEYDSGYAGGFCYTFNPTDDNELAVFKSGGVVLMKRN